MEEGRKKVSEVFASSHRRWRLCADTFAYFPSPLPIARCLLPRRKAHCLAAGPTALRCNAAARLDTDAFAYFRIPSRANRLPWAGRRAHPAFAARAASAEWARRLPIPTCLAGWPVAEPHGRLPSHVPKCLATSPAARRQPQAAPSGHISRVSEPRSPTHSTPPTLLPSAFAFPG